MSGMSRKELKRRDRWLRHGIRSYRRYGFTPSDAAQAMFDAANEMARKFKRSRLPKEAR